MKKAVSIALFGDANRKDGSGQNYHVYLPSYVIAFANLFPADEGWELHVHIDGVTLNSRYGQTLSRMVEAGLVKLAVMGADALLTRAMLWRMAPVFVPGVDYCFARDIDCVPMPRDRAICDVFIASNCVVHAPMDAGAHAGIMGGMCGFKTEAFRQSTGLNSLDDLYAFAKKSESEWAQHGTDQHVLNRLIDRPGGPTLLEHRYAGWHAGPNTYKPKLRGEYRCKAMSTPTPDVGKSKLTGELQFKADLLANHLGSAGYDHLAARAFWEEHGSPAITKLVRECES